MVAAEPANRIDDLIHLSQWYPIHLPVQFLEIRLYLLVIIGIVLVEAFIEQPQDRIRMYLLLWSQFLMPSGINCPTPI